MRAVEGQRLFGFDEAAALSNAARADLVEPDRSEDGEQPPVEPGSGRELVGALHRAHAGRPNEIVGGVARGRENDGVAPQARQAGLEPQAHFALAGFAHVPSTHGFRGLRMRSANSTKVAWTSWSGVATLRRFKYAWLISWAPAVS